MNALINPFVMASAKGAAWLLVWSWQAAVLLACVWAGLKIFRVKSPALRHQVWLFALIVVVAMPVLSGVVQNLPLPRPNNKALSYAVELPRIVITNDDAPVVQNPSPAVSVRPSIKQPIILSLSFALWLAGALVFVTKAAINGARLRRLRTSARLTSLADLDCDKCDCEALRAGKARLAFSDEIRSPILLGVLRPMIVFPADIASWTSPMERCAMLRHELAHIARRDHYVNFFQTILGAVFFFHPLVRYVCRQLTVEREMACDDHVVGSGIEAEAYAESIIKVAERSVAPVGAPCGAQQLALFSARQILERRIEMILNKDRVRVIAHQWRYLALYVAMIAAISLLLMSSRAGKIAAQPVVNSDEQILIGMVRQVAEGIPRRVNFGGPSPNPNLKLENFMGLTGEPMWRTFDGFAREKLTVTRVEVNDFHVKIDGDGATVEFLGTIYFRDPALIEEKSSADRFTVWMIKANGQWRGVPLPPPPPRPLNDDAPPPPPPPPPPPSPLFVNEVSAFQDSLKNLQAPLTQTAPLLPPSSEMTVESNKAFKSLPWHENEDSILVLLREIFYANMRRDTAFFGRTLDEEFLATGPNGETLNKAQTIAEVRRLDYEIKKVEFDDVRVSDNNHTALATVLGTVYYKSDGQDSTIQFRYTVNFVRKAGQWKVVAIHMSRKQ